MSTISGSYDTSSHQPEISDKPPAQNDAQGGLEVFGEPSTPTEPGESTLDDPAARQHFEPAELIGALDHLDRPAADLRQFQPQLVAGIAAIGEDMAQPGVEISDRGKDADGTIAILNIGGMDLQPHQVPECVDNDVALAALDLLASIIASGTAALRRLDRLAIDHASVWAGFAPHLLARGHDQHVVDLSQPAIARPAVEITLDRRIRGKLLRNLPPLATRCSHVEQRLHDRAQVGFARSPDHASHRHQWRDQGPFGIGHVACVAQPLAPILSASDLTPGHREPHRLCRNNDGITTY